MTDPHMTYQECITNIMLSDGHSACTLCFSAANLQAVNPDGPAPCLCQLTIVFDQDDTRQRDNLNLLASLPAAPLSFYLNHHKKTGTIRCTKDSQVTVEVEDRLEYCYPIEANC